WISAGLETSPVTPGNTAPHGSFALPAIIPRTCALALPHSANPTSSAIAARITCFIVASPLAPRTPLRSPRRGGAKPLTEVGNKTARTHEPVKLMRAEERFERFERLSRDISVRAHRT